MIAVDTNVVVRIVTNDDPAQARRAARLLEKQDFFLSNTVLLELVWVLESAYQLKRPNIIRALHALLGLPNLVSDKHTRLLQVLEHYRAGMDFADALHLAVLPEGQMFYTFDQRLEKKAKLLKLENVSEP